MIDEMKIQAWLAAVLKTPGDHAGHVLLARAALGDTMAQFLIQRDRWTAFYEIERLMKEGN